MQQTLTVSSRYVLLKWFPNPMHVLNYSFTHNPKQSRTWEISKSMSIIEKSVWRALLISHLCSTHHNHHHTIQVALHACCTWINVIARTIQLVFYLKGNGPPSPPSNSPNWTYMIRRGSYMFTMSNRTTILSLNKYFELNKLPGLPPQLELLAVFNCREPLNATQYTLQLPHT